MNKFVFHNKTIVEARNELNKNMGSEYLLHNGVVVTLESVSELKEILIGFTNHYQPKLLSDSTPDPDSMTSYKSLIGFSVKLMRKTPNGYESWTEDIGIPLNKFTIETEFERSIIHNFIQ